MPHESSQRSLLESRYAELIGDETPFRVRSQRIAARSSEPTSGEVNDYNVPIEVALVAFGYLGHDTLVTWHQLFAEAGVLGPKQP